MKRFSSKMMKLAALLVLVCLLMTGCALLPTTITDVADGAAVDGDTVTITKEEYERLMKYAEIEELKQIVEQYYYQEPDEQAMLDGAAAGLLYVLDEPYTFYYTTENYAKMW